MIEVQLKTNAESESRRYGEETRDKVTDAIIEGMRRSIKHVGHISARDFLHGPRPKNLDIVSSRLIRGMMGSPSFAIAGTKSAGREESIERIRTWHGHIIGRKGVKTFRPFDYPRYWEKVGRRGTDLRPFAEPALKEASKDFEEFFQQELDEIEVE